MTTLPEGGNQEQESPSLLTEIIQKASENANIQSGNVEDKIGSSLENNSSAGVLQKKQEPISFGDFMKFMGAILFVVVIFFGSFLAYIVFHPEQTGFFQSMFGISRDGISILLKKLINGSFGVILFILSIVWIITLFRTIWTPKELKRKRIVHGFISGLIGILLFSVMSIWAFLFQTINATDYTNPEGVIVLYDNTLYQDKEMREYAPILQSDLIGPIDVLFDLRVNADMLERKNGVKVESYTIDSNEGVCNNGKSVIDGTSIAGESSIVCTFERIKTYAITGRYNVVTPTGERKIIPMSIAPINIRGLVSIESTKNIQGQNLMILNAKSLKNIAIPKWEYFDSHKIIENDSLSEVITDTKKYICLKLVQDCDRIFVVQRSTDEYFDGEIVAQNELFDPLSYTFSLSGQSLDVNQISQLEWSIRENQYGSQVICKNTVDLCKYEFRNYGDHVIEVNIITGNQKTITLKKNIQILEPIHLSKRADLLDTLGNKLNKDSTYRSDLKAYVIESIGQPPLTIILDTNNIRSDDDAYIFVIGKWVIKLDGVNIAEKKGERAEFLLQKPGRYTIEATYSFKNQNNSSVSDVHELMILNLEEKRLNPVVKTFVDSDYVPTIVTVDASQSTSKDGEIKKFIFDFGEGKTPAEGDAIQKYEYITPGEKKIIVTIIGDGGAKASIEKTIILKSEAKKISFTPSMTPGIAGSIIDFEAVGTTGDIAEYIWSFGDNTQSERGYTTPHIFEKAGTYTIGLTIIYKDGTRDTLNKEYTIIKDS